MSNKAKKMAVFDFLVKEKQPISLIDIVAKLGSEFTERSVRRWLSEFIASGLVEKKGQKRGTLYLAMPSGQFNHVSQIIINKLQRPIYERNPATYHFEWLENYVPNESFYLSAEKISQLHKAGQRLNHHEPAGTYAHLIYNHLLIDLSYNSSRLEGNTYSLLDTKRLILEGKEVSGKLNEEKIMILNHTEAIRFLVDNSSRLQMNEQTILTLHYLLADGLIEPQYAGKIRDHGVRIGGSTYIPLENPHQLKKQLHLVLQKASQINNPYEQSIFLLAHLSYLQSFIDVNKRTARLSANIPLIKNNLVPLSFKDINKDDYASALIAVYEEREIEPLIDLYRYSYLRTCKDYDATVISIHYDEIRVRYRSQRRAAIAEIIIKKLSHHKLKNFITSQAEENIPIKDREKFIKDLYQDLQDIDEVRIAGLGVTAKQLQEWLKQANKK